MNITLQPLQVSLQNHIWFHELFPCLLPAALWSTGKWRTLSILRWHSLVSHLVSHHTDCIIRNVLIVHGSLLLDDVTASLNKMILPTGRHTTYRFFQFRRGRIDVIIATMHFVANSQQPSERIRHSEWCPCSFIHRLQYIAMYWNSKMSIRAFVET